MRSLVQKIAGAATVAPGLVVLAALTSTVLGDEPSRIGRLFRLGQSTPSTHPQQDDRPIESVDAPIRMIDSGVPGPATVQPGKLQAQPRLIPQPRVTRAVTDSDPIVTRISIARSDDGHSFGMFLQVYADGTVIDSEGVHTASKESLRGVSRALEATELYRLKGHCGSPSTDFVEQVQMVVYERSLRGLRANAFSFSGNPQGCDHAVQHLQKALDDLQARLSRTTTEMPAATTSPLPQPLSQPSRPSAPILLNADANPRD